MIYNFLGDEIETFFREPTNAFISEQGKIETGILLKL